MKILRLLDNLSKELLWKLPMKMGGTNSFVAHILVFENPAYIRISAIAARSFLFWNRNSSVILHCNAEILPKIRKEFKKELARKRLRVELLGGEKLISWKQHKIELLSSLRDSNHFYMDADMRWNGSIPKIDGITFYVKEYAFIERPHLLKYISMVNQSTNVEGSMLNTSFFFPNGLVDQDEFRAESLNYLQKIESGLSKLSTEEQSQLFLPHLSEQLAISMYFSKQKMKINFLKESDRHRDGAFIESSYFGSTGVSF
jgi:hypothetical protein